MAIQSVPATSAVLREAISEGLGPRPDRSRDATRIYDKAPTVRMKSMSMSSTYWGVCGKWTKPATRVTTRTASLMRMAAITLAMDLTVAYFFTSWLHPEIRIPGTVPTRAATNHLSTMAV